MTRCFGAYCQPTELVNFVDLLSSGVVLEPRFGPQYKNKSRPIDLGLETKVLALV